MGACQQNRAGWGGISKVYDSLNRLLSKTPDPTLNEPTESFTYTLSRDLNLSRASMQFSADQGFSNHQRNHLVGISDATTAWQKEVGLARSEGVEAVVLFALDQLCLIGYPCPLTESTRRSTFQG